MYKKDFYIAVAEKHYRKTLGHFEKVSGYGEVLRTRKGREIEFGFDKRSGGWYITEISTGMGLGCVYETRMKALASLTADMLNKVEIALNTDTAKAVSRNLMEYKAKCA